VAIRTCYSALMHATATAIVGAALGWARMRPLPIRIFALLAGLIIAVAIHALWNGLLTLDAQIEADGKLALVDFVLFPIELLVTMVVFQLCLLAERKTLRRELRDEAEKGGLPAAHIDPLTTYLRRGLQRWAPPGVDQRAYIKVATTLALRKDQARRARGHKAELYRHDVERLRSELSGILASAKTTT